MKLARGLLFSVLGLVLPIGVALAAYGVSARSFDTEPPLVTVERIAEPQSPSATLSPTPSPATVVAPTPFETGSPDDRGGRCSEPEHIGDPECLSGGDTDNSGPGGGGNSGSGSGSSGSGSSGSGGGDD
jgi:uncharacterized membrane protein YgcG